MTANTILILLIVVGVIGVIGYAVWASRQNKSKVFKNDTSFTRDARLQAQEQPAPLMKAPATPLSQPADIHHEPFFNESPNIEQAEPVLDTPSAEQKVAAETENHPNNEVPMYTNFDHIQVELPKRQRPTLDVVKQQAEKTSQIYPDFFESLTAPKAPETSLATKKTEPKTNVETAVETPAEVAESKPVEPRREVLELWLVAQQGQAFAGEMLSTAFAKQRFSLGAKNVYCRYRENSSAMPIAFRVANGDVASGEFDVQNFAESNVQALVFFMFLSDDHHQDEANLHLMLHSAETLAQTLNGDLLTGEQKPFDETQKTQYFAQVNPVEIKG